MALQPVDTTTQDAQSYKGNDIDSDGDGVVDEANHAENAATADDADTLDGQEPGSLSVDHAATADDADTLGGEDPGAFADSDHDHTDDTLDPDEVSIASQLTVPVYPDTGDVPSQPEGSVVFIEGDGLYVEDGS